MTEANEHHRRRTGEGDTHVGSLVEEASKLFEALRSQGGTSGGIGDYAAELFRDLNHHLASGDDCRYCPVCRLIELARRPEVRRHLTSAAGSIAAALASALATPAPGDSRPQTSPDGARERQS